MLTQHESPAPAPAAVSGTSQKLLQLLRKRLRQLLRVTLVLAIGLALAATALAIWWLTSLNGLPDIGDPFDVAAFRAFRVPDDQNAFTFLRRADEKLTPLPELPRGAIRALTVAWSRRIRSRGDGSRRIARRSNCFSRGPNNPTDREPGRRIRGRHRGSTDLTLLALLEGGRRQESGDTAGAWDCYRAVLRMTTHIRRRGSLDQRQDVDGILERLAAATARDLGGRSEDHDPPAS